MFNLSVITINLNNFIGLKRTFESLQIQTFNNFEFIIIDGQSNDESLNYIRSISLANFFWISEKDSGIYNAMNKGISKSNGKYLLFLNSGDCLYDQFVLENIFQRNQYEEDILYGDTIYEYNNGKKILKTTQRILTLNYLINDDINHQSAFFKRELFYKYGFYDESYKISADYKIFLKYLFKHKVSYIHVNLIISIYNLNGISSLNENLQFHERSKIFFELFPFVFIKKRINLFFKRIISFFYIKFKTISDFNSL